MIKLNQQTLLIVDDEPLNIKVVGQALSKRYRILTATTGIKALEIAQSDQKPDLILLDIQLPDLDGHQVCRQLKSQSETKDIPIIFITGRDGVEDEALGLELGAVDYIVKPFNLPIVIARVRNQMQLKRKTDLLERLVSIDGLTEIHNRRFFDEALPLEWRRLARSASPLALIMIDIDNFKAYNDNYGHQEGDHCLKLVASALDETVHRGADKVCRFGGEEFVVILPETDFDNAKKVAEQLRVAIEKLAIKHEYSDVTDIVTISLGLAVATPSADLSAELLLEHADKLLYKAKQEGKNNTQSGAF